MGSMPNNFVEKKCSSMQAEIRERKSGNHSENLKNLKCQKKNMRLRACTQINQPAESGIQSPCFAMEVIMALGFTGEVISVLLWKGCSQITGFYLWYHPQVLVVL